MKNNILYLMLILITITQGFVKAKTFSVSEINAIDYPKVFCTFTAFDDLGNNYGNLTTKDLIIYDNGILIQPSSMSLNCSSDLPLSVVLVLDESTTMNEVVNGVKKWDWVIQGAKSFIDNIELKGESQIALTTFTNYAQIICPFTTNKNTVINALNSLPAIPSGGTDYNSAFLEKNSGAYEVLKTSPISHRRVIVFLSDGEHDNRRGILQTQNIINLLVNSNMKLYAINLLSNYNGDLDYMCRNTAGKYFDVYTKNELNTIYRDIASNANTGIHCELSWIAPNICDKPSLNRTAYISLPKYGLESYRYYSVTEDKMKKYIPDKSVYLWGNSDTVKYEDKIISITAENDSFKINNIDVLPNNYFTIVDWGDGSGIKPTFPITQLIHEVKKIKIRFTQSVPKNIQKATLVVTSTPCNLNIPLVGGVQQIIIDKPIENDLFSDCDTVKIQWSGVDPNVLIDLFYSTDNGFNWNLIASKVSGLKFNWLSHNLNSKVRIKAVVLSNSYSTSDITQEFIISKPILNFADKTFDFGELVLGDSTESNAKKYIINAGLIPFKITNTTITGINLVNFKLLHKYINDIIMPGDSIELDIQFKTLKLGKHQAIFTISGVCADPISLNLIGNGVCGGKAIDTLKFGDQNLFKPKIDTIKCAFYNQTEFPVTLAPLIRGTNYQDFSISFPSYENVSFGEVTVLPKNCLDLIVTFSPKSIGFRNAYINYFVKSPCKNVLTQLLGNGISSDVIVTSIDWKEKRVLGKYSDIIIIKNNSSEDENITAIEYENPETDSIFIFDVPSFPLLVPADTSITINVKFNPKDEIIYENNIILTATRKTEKLKANLKGIGILPKLETAWLCGDTVNLGDSTIAYLILKNPSTSADLLINNIEFEKIGNEYNWQNGTIITDIVLSSNEERQFPVIYSPQLNSDHTNKVLIYADNYDASFSNQWKTTIVPTSCDGLELKEESPIDYKDLVICDNSVLKTKVSNLSKQSSVQVYGTKATITGKDMSSFKLMNKIDINLSSNQTFDYEIQFEPTRIGQHTAQLNLPNSTKNDIVIELKGNGVDFTASTSDLKFEFDPGKTYTLPFIAQIPDVSKNSIDSISVLISYNQFALNFEPFSIKSLISTNSTSAEYLIWSSPDLTKNGLISVTGIGKLYDNQRIELFTLDFMALLTDKHESDLNFGFDYGCTNELIKVADVKISEVCFNDNRILVSSGTAFVLSDPNPNPIASNSMVEYSVGFDVFTEIEVYNSLGELVYKPVSNFTSVGSHSTNINTEKLSSGIYFMKMNAGPFSSVKRIIISK